MRQPYGDVLRVPEFGFEPDHSVFEGFVETGFGADFDYFSVVGALDLYQDLIGNLLIAGLFGRPSRSAVRRGRAVCRGTSGIFRLSHSLLLSSSHSEFTIYILTYW